MCLITEHAKALVELRETKKRIQELESRLELPEPAKVISRLYRQDFIALLAPSGILPIAIDAPLDSVITITSKAELDRIAPYLVYPADQYVAETWDCEDYGIRAQSDAALKFGVNGIRLCLGTSPVGFHAFVVTVDTESKVWWLEPNAGFEFAGVWQAVGTQGYKPEKVLA